MTLTGMLRILLVGVGGQGVLTLSRCLGDAALAAGRPVMVGQPHGMSQKGGSVESTVVLGPARSSFIGSAEADIVIGLEPLETLRALPRFSSSACVVVNRGVIVPFQMVLQGQTYPDIDEMMEMLERKAGELIQIDGPALVQQAENPRALNMIMLGVMAGISLVPFSAEELWAAAERRSKPAHREENNVAFQIGLKVGKETER